MLGDIQDVYLGDVRGIYPQDGAGAGPTYRQLRGNRANTPYASGRGQHS
jgi:hypothetical protein